MIFASLFLINDYGVGKRCEKNDDRVTKNNKSCHIFIMWLKRPFSKTFCSGFFNCQMSSFLTTAFAGLVIFPLVEISLEEHMPILGGRGYPFNRKFRGKSLAPFCLTLILSRKYPFLNLENRIVVYFDQWTGAPHAVCWLKSIFWC